MDDSESSPPALKALTLSVSFPGWRTANSAFKSWASKMSLLHRPTWQKAGIFEAVIASTKRFEKNTDLVLSIAERWCPDTNTFLFPWGEATVTLEDVMVLLGFSVLGSPVFAPLDGSGEKTVGKLWEEWFKIKKDKNVSFVTQVTWMGRFMGTGDELEHAAFLALWLSYFVLPTRYCHVDKAVLPIAVHLSRGNRIALAPPVLAHLYAELTLLKDHIRCFNMAIGFNVKLELSSLFKLVQVWTWERFRELRPSNTNLLLQGEPRLALWDEEKLKRTRSGVRKRTESIVRKILANSRMDSFEWRPYTKAVKNWKFPQFYSEKAMWVPVGPDLDEELISFARCVKASELVGVHSVEHYFPNRVASQFGLLQDVPCPVNRNNLSREVAWNEYDKPIDDLILFIPSRSTVSCFTSMFCEWWGKDNQAVELAESSTPRNMIRSGDDDTSELVPCGSKKRKSMELVCKKDETHMDLYQTQVPSEKDEEDDSLTISKVKRSRKKNTAAMCSSHENQSLDPPPKVLPLREAVQKLGKEFPAKLKRSRYLRTPTNVRSEIADSGGSASREVPLNELCQKEVVLKRKSEHLGDNQAREDDDDESCKDCYDNIATAEMVIDREKGVRDASESLGKRNNRLDADNNDSWIRQKIAYEDETVEQREETGNKAGKNMVLSLANCNNSSDLPLGANGGVVDIVVSGPETRQKCNDDIGVNGSNTEKKKTIIDGATKEAKCLLHKDGENWKQSREEHGQEDETVAPLEIEQRSEDETGNKAGENMVLSSANVNNSSDPPLDANGGVADIVMSRPKTRKKCDDLVDVNRIKAEKRKTIVAEASKEAKCVIHEDGENQRSNEKEDVDECLKQRDLAIDELALSLDARMMKVEKTLAKIREWKTIERNQTKHGINA